MKNILLLYFLLISANLFAQSEVQVSVTLKNVENAPFLVEGCKTEPDSLIFQVVPEDTLNSNGFTVTFTGSATAGEDYTHNIPDTITFQPGESIATFPIQAIADNDQEETENIIIQLTNMDGRVIQNFTLLLLNELVVSIAPDTEQLSVCQDDQVTLRAEPAFPFNWSLGDLQATDSIFSFRAESISTVILSAQIGSCNAEDRISIDLKAGVQFTEGDTAYVCAPDSVELRTNIIGSPGSIIWAPLDSTIAVRPDLRSALINTVSTKSYMITVETDECTVSDTIVVRIDSLPDELPITVVPEKEEYCPGEVVTLFSRYLAPVDFPDVQFKWEWDAGTALSADTLENFAFTTTDTSVFRRTTTNNACKSIDSVELIVINPPIELSLTDTVVCPNNPVKVVLENPEDFEKIEWSPEQGISCTDCPDPTIRTATSATYMLMLEEKGCPFGASVTVNIFPPQILEVVPDTAVCPNQPVLLSVANPEGFSDFSWTGTGLGCMNCETPMVVTATSGFYQVSAERDDGCLGLGSATVNIIPPPQITITPDSSVVNAPLPQGNMVTLEATDVPNASYQWFYNGESISETNSIITVTILGLENNWEVIVTTPEGCQGSDNIDIAGKEPEFDIPSAFTPNNDNLNDRFKVIISGTIELIDFKVFNRWGQMVFDGSDSLGWDGNHNGEESPSDVYAYMATLRYLDGSVEQVRGEVTLIR